jgi:hypothetical protein
MTLRERLLDAVIDGHLGHGLIVTRQEVMAHFPSDPATYTGVMLSNSEMITGQHSPTYDHFTLRVAEACYRIHPLALSERMQTRGLLPPLEN